MYSVALETFRTKQSQHSVETDKFSKPLNYKIPALSDSNFWKDYYKGWISEEEVQQAHDNFEMRRNRAKASLGKRSESPRRYWKLPPPQTKQYSQQMCTEFLDDHRLTSTSKNVLVRLVSLAGHKTYLETNKTSLAKIMGVSISTIQRSLKELMIFGYLDKESKQSNITGFFIGLKISLKQKVYPYFRKVKDIFEESLQSLGCENDISPCFSDRSRMNYINNLYYNNTDSDKNLSTETEKIPI